MPDNAWKNQADAWIFRAVQLAARGARGILINNHAQNAQQIRTQVNALAPFFDFIGYDDLSERLNFKRGGKPFCLLTFDDGKAINATETAPELLRLGVPAVFYIVTGSMGSEKALWFDRLTALRTASRSEKLPEYSELEAVSWRERDRIINKLCAQFGVDADLADASARVMSWDEAAQLQRHGFEIGSHTINHALLPTETPEEAQRQIEGSMQEMVQNGLRNCRTFAFPKGRASASLLETARGAGLESAMTTVPVWIGKRDALDSLPRLYLKERASANHIHTKLLAARTGFALKNPSGDGRRYLFSP